MANWLPEIKNPFDGWDPFQEVQKLLDEAFRVVTDTIRESIDGLVSGVTGFVTGVIDGVTGFFNGIGEFVGGVFTGVRDFFGEISKSLGEFFGGIGTGIADFSKGIVTGVTDFFNGLGQGIMDFFGGIWTGYLDALKGWYAWLGDVLHQFFSVFLGGMLGIYLTNWYWTIPVTIFGIVAIWYVFFRNTRKHPTTYDKMVDANLRGADYMMKQHETASRYITGNVSHNQFLQRQAIKERNWSRWKK